MICPGSQKEVLEEKDQSSCFSSGPTSGVCCECRKVVQMDGFAKAIVHEASKGALVETQIIRNIYESDEIRSDIPFREEEDGIRINQLEEGIRWLAQTVHQASHEGAIEECRRNTCDYARQLVPKLR